MLHELAHHLHNHKGTIRDRRDFQRNEGEATRSALSWAEELGLRFEPWAE